MISVVGQYAHEVGPVERNPVAESGDAEHKANDFVAVERSHKHRPDTAGGGEQVWRCLVGKGIAPYDRLDIVYLQILCLAV
jgi:hypothetical protein